MKRLRRGFSVERLGANDAQQLAQNETIFQNAMRQLGGGGPHVPARGMIARHAIARRALRECLEAARSDSPLERRGTAHIEPLRDFLVAAAGLPIPL